MDGRWRMQYRFRELKPLKDTRCLSKDAASFLDRQGASRMSSTRLRTKWHPGTYWTGRIRVEDSRRYVSHEGKIVNLLSVSSISRRVSIPFCLFLRKLNIQRNIQCYSRILFVLHNMLISSHAHIHGAIAATWSRQVAPTPANASNDHSWETPLPYRRRHYLAVTSKQQDHGRHDT